MHTLPKGVNNLDFMSARWDDMNWYRARTNMSSAYHIQELLGKGSYGSVYRANHKENGKQYAIKMIHLTHHMSPYTKMCLLNELRMLATHACPYVVIFKEAYVQQNTFCLVTEYAANGDLLRLIKTASTKRARIPENTVWHVFLQTSIAVDYLHKLNVLHRDLKPANVLLDVHQNVKVADLGIVKILRNAGYGQTQIGTPLYMSPEILRRERYGPKSDAWALGCILFELLHLRPAFYASSVYLLRNHILSGEYVRHTPHYSMAMNEVVTSLLRVHTRSRLDVATLLSKPDIVSQMAMRGFERSRCNPEVKPLFYKACVPPSRAEEWKAIADMFCDLNHTIRLSESSEQRVRLIRDIRERLEKPPSRAGASRMVSSRTPARVLPSRAGSHRTGTPNRKKAQAEIDEYERKVHLLKKQVVYYEKIIERLRKDLA